MNNNEAKVTPTPIATVRSTITVKKKVKNRMVLSEGLIFAIWIKCFKSDIPHETMKSTAASAVIGM